MKKKILITGLILALVAGGAYLGIKLTNATLQPVSLSELYGKNYESVLSSETGEGGNPSGDKTEDGSSSNVKIITEPVPLGKSEARDVNDIDFDAISSWANQGYIYTWFESFTYQDFGNVYGVTQEMLSDEIHGVNELATRERGKDAGIPICEDPNAVEQILVEYMRHFGSDVPMITYNGKYAAVHYNFEELFEKTDTSGRAGYYNANTGTQQYSQYFKGLDIKLDNFKTLAFSGVNISTYDVKFVFIVEADVTCVAKSEDFAGCEWLPDGGKTETVRFVAASGALEDEHSYTLPYIVVRVLEKGA